MLQPRLMWAFAKSVLAGSVAGAAPFLVFTVPLALFSLVNGGLDGRGSMIGTLLLAVVPLIVTFPIVLGASILIGLPLTYLLRRRGRDQSAIYVAVGGVAGCTIPITALLVAGSSDGYWTAILGTISGVVTGWVWWSTRSDVTTSRHPFPQPPLASPPAAR